MALTIKPLSPELAADYLDFFERRAFSDGSPYYPCYCCAFQMTMGQIQAEFFDRARTGGGGTEAFRLAMRDCAERMIGEGRLRGYLAFDGGEVVGWCNANDRENYVRTGEFSLEDIPEDGDDPAPEGERVRSIVCFAVAPDCRGRGIASTLLHRVCEDAAGDGCTAVEGYPVAREELETLDFTGPMRMYEKAGVICVDRRGGTLVMRKNLLPSAQDVYRRSN